MKDLSNTINASQEGFSLVEVLIAMVVFAVGVMAVAQMQSHAQAANSRAYHQTQATIYASNQIEAFVNASFSDPLLAENATPVYHSMDKKSKYGLTWTITGVDQMVIRLKVSWTERSGNKELFFEIVKNS